MLNPVVRIRRPGHAPWLEHGECMRLCHTSGFAPQLGIPRSILVQVDDF